MQLLCDGREKTPTKHLKFIKYSRCRWNFFCSSIYSSSGAAFSLLNILSSVTDPVLSYSCSKNADLAMSLVHETGDYCGSDCIYRRVLSSLCGDGRSSGGRLSWSLTKCTPSAPQSLQKCVCVQVGGRMSGKSLMWLRSLLLLLSLCSASPAQWCTIMFTLMWSFQRPKVQRK